MDFSGIIKQIGPTETLNTRTGKRYTRRVVIVEQPGTFPQSMAIELLNEKAVGFAAVCGCKGTFKINFRANGTANGSFFNSIRAWDYTINEWASEKKQQA